VTTGITTWTATGKVWRSGYERKFVFCSGYNAPTLTKDGIDVQLDTLSVLFSIVSGQAALLKPDNPSSSSTRDVLGSSGSSPGNYDKCTVQFTYTTILLLRHYHSFLCLRLFQKRVVRTKFDISVFITINR
jgi:hypothetical protein